MIHLTNESGTVKWKSPSNIALVKYWGKHGRQLPRNPSISFTLDNAHTITEVRYKETANALAQPSVAFSFEGAPMPAFRNKIIKYLDSIKDLFPLVSNLEFDISSSNSFPHSSGIASSASSMAALALCLLSIDKKIYQREHINMQLASSLARLGSGSASRSVYGPLVIWGKTTVSSESSDEYAIPYTENIDPVFFSFHDDILIISKSEKAVSSTAGHALMEDNPYSKARFQQADTHMSELVSAMQNGDLDKFGLIVEKEALTLHALMMASSPPYMLMEPNTLEVIKRIKAYRNETKIPVYFTLDAGPNIHLLYPDAYSNQVNKLKKSLVSYCEGGTIINDHVGNGPEQLI